MSALLARALAALLSFAFITGIASLAPSHHWDRAVTIWLQHAAPTVDVPAAAFVLLGNAEVMIPGVALACLLLPARGPRRRVATLSLIAGLVALSVLGVALKHVIPHPGPPPALQRHVFKGTINLHMPFSYPSGHAMRVTLIAATLLRRFPVLATALAVCMMAALVYLGKHWATDVVGGFFLGWACAEAIGFLGIDRDRYALVRQVASRAHLARHERQSKESDC